MALVQFVDQIGTSPTIRLDLNSTTSGLMVAVEGIDLSPPPLRRAAVATMLADGEQITAATFGNRMLNLPLRLIVSTAEAAATTLQNLARELNRESNFLRLHLDGMTNPVFFRTGRAPDYTLSMLRLLVASASGMVLDIPAEPFGYGLRQTLPAATVYNDPEEGATLNANPSFETDASNWTVTGGTFARSTVRAFDGAASGLLTPNGVAAEAIALTEQVAVPPSTAVRVSAWVYCSVTRIVRVEISWFDSGHVAISTGNAAASATVTLATWTWLDGVLTSPANAAYAQLRVTEQSTPPAGHTLWIDEARLRVPRTVGGMCFDVTGVLGDVETPLYLSLPNTAPGLYGRTSCVAVRRRGTPAQVPFVLQASAMSVSTDTTLQSFDPLMSGWGNNFARVTFATATSLVDRLDTTSWPGGVNVDIRGDYRVFVRIRHSSAGDIIQMRLRILHNGYAIDGKLVTAQQVSLIRWLDLGLITFPAGADPVTDGISGVELPVSGSQSTMMLLASRVSGSGTLDINELVFVPADDRMCKIVWPLNSGPDAYVLDSQREMGYSTVTSGAVRSDQPIGIESGPPMVSPGVTNRIYFLRSVDAYDSGLGNDDRTAASVVNAYYWPRYLFIRPAGT